LNVQSSYGFTALHHASYQENNLDVVKYLVEKGAQLNVKNNEGRTALHFASLVEYNSDVVNYLVEKGAQLNIKNNEDSSPLHDALNGDDLDVVEKGVPLNREDKKSFSMCNII
jgi:ankyrin repeat protein